MKPIFTVVFILLFSPHILNAKSDLEQLVQTARHNDAVTVESLLQRSKDLREKIPPFLSDATQALESHKGALPSGLSVRIASAIQEANSIRTALFPFALKYRHSLYRTDESLDDRDRIESIVISMASALCLYDNASFMENHFSNKSTLREKLNEAYPEYNIQDNYYKDSLMRANKLSYRSNMLDAVTFFKSNEKTITFHIANSDPQIRALYDYIIHSPVRASMENESIFNSIGHEITVLLGQGITSSINACGKLKFNISKGVGNTMGLVRWRNGKLKDDTLFLSEFSQHLRPGDILLEKTPFALTDKTIPGHFGHAALYIGTYAQLEELGMLDSPFIKQHLSEIRQGKVILEALREGVVLNSVEHFMNIDDVAVLRSKNLAPNEIKTSLTLGLSHYGKKYDFDFNVNTTETIVCSELVYAAYPQIDFVTKKVLTSFTITPDDIAKLALDNPLAPLELTFFAHDGKKVYVKGENTKGKTLYQTLVGLDDKNTDNGKVQ